MKKSKIKKAVKDGIKIFYAVGLTNTAASVQAEIFKNIDRLYHNKKKVNKQRKKF